MSNELAHYGILGMKWGVRRPVGANGLINRSAKKTEKQEDREIKNSRRHDSKNRRRLSDKDLMEKIGRLKREKELRELTDEEINSGKTKTKEIMKSVGTKVAITVLSGGALYAIKAALTGDLDIKEAAAYLTPKPGKK